MKTIIQQTKILSILLISVTLIITASCSKDESTEPPTENGGNNNSGNNGGNNGGENSVNLNEINTLIASLSYNSNDLLNVQDTGGESSKRTETNARNTTSGLVQGQTDECRIVDYNLESNFDDVAILRPTNGVVYPGALVIGNQGLLDGAPDPLTLGRSQATLRLDLPGIGEQGTILVDDPSSNSAVQTGIDNALEWWNANAYQDGYVNAANSTYQATTSYAKKQFSLDVGLNVEWASGSLDSQFNFESTTTNRVAAIVFRQVFYTVTMDTPSSPASVFAPEVTRANAEAAFGSDTPPAYVSSVSYGRIIMVRMETTEKDTSIELDAVLEYAGGFRSATGTLESKYDEVLKNSSLTVVTIGGNAEAASEAISLANINTGFNSLNDVITGENAVYNRNNPGVPIAYTVRYLQDNSLAKMGYTTDYSVETCNKFNFDHESVDVDNNSIFDVRFRFVYKTAGTNNTVIGGYTTVNNGQRKVVSPPNGAHDVEVEFQFQDAFVWRALGSPRSYNYIRSQKCFEVTNDLLLRITLAPKSCN